MDEFVIKGYILETVLDSFEAFLRRELLDQKRAVKVKSYSTRPVDHEIRKWIGRYRRLRDRRDGERRAFLDRFIERREEAEAHASDNIASLVVTVRALSRHDAQSYARVLGDYQFSCLGLRARFYDDSEDAIMRHVYLSDCGCASINPAVAFAVLSREEYRARNQ